jgi:hypothetical protein
VCVPFMSSKDLPILYHPTLRGGHSLRIVPERKLGTVRPAHGDLPVGLL